MRLNFLLITASHTTLSSLSYTKNTRQVVASLDGERYKAVVLPDVPLEDVGAGAQHPLKPCPVELDTPDNNTNDSFEMVKYVSFALLITSLEKIKSIMYFYYFSGPTAVTVAARGLSSIRAISPK